MDFNNLFIGYSDVDLFEAKFLDAFEKLPYRQKVFFTAKQIYKTPSSVWISECKDLPYIENLFTYPYLYKRHFDVIDWLNGGMGKPTLFYLLLNKLLEVK